MTKNLQINDMVKAMIDSEPCLFNNSSSNLMPVITPNEFRYLGEAAKVPVHTRQSEINEHMFAIAAWHSHLQYRFEVDLFGHSLYTSPINVLTVADDQG